MSVVSERIEPLRIRFSHQGSTAGVLYYTIPTILVVHLKILGKWYGYQKIKDFLYDDKQSKLNEDTLREQLPLISDFAVHHFHMDE